MRMRHDHLTEDHFDDFADNLDPAPPRRFSLPAWAPLAVGAGVVIWAVSIWWMVATLPAAAAGTASDPALAQQLSTLTARLDTLAIEVEALRADRDTLAARLDAFDALALAASTPVQEPFVTAAGDEAASEDADIADLRPEASPFFTDGKDTYNCRDFKSFADAQEALRVNGPGDPNRIDMNRNGIACEDFAYPDRPLR